VSQDAAELVRRLDAERPRWLRFVRRRVRSDADAEDVLQAALLRAASHAETLDDAERTDAWFASILRNAVVDHHRARATRSAPTSDVALDEIATPTDAGTEAARGLCSCGDQLMRELNPPYADILRRVDLGEEALDDVARASGIGAGNARVRLHRARRSLRDLVERHCGVTTLRGCFDCTCDEGVRCG
jgi:RNA polymerase sigma-70 factor (ECF subfamily)